MKTEITFYSGIHTIGGVVMTIKYGKHQVLLEMGTYYDPQTDVFDGQIKIRQHNWLQDFCKLDNAPAVPYIYDRDLLGALELQSIQESKIHTSCFITHLHQDHMSAMGYLSDRVDVYMSKAAQKLYATLVQIEPIINIRTTEYFDIIDQQIVNIGEIKVTPFLLNKHGFQDWSFYVETPDCKLHYTGDVFLHGDYADVVLKEMEIIQEKNIDILVCESTSYMDSILKQIYDEIPNKVEPTLDLLGMMSTEMNDKYLFSRLLEQDSLCFLNFYSREMTDIMKYEKWADQTDRVMVYEPEAAFLINVFFERYVNYYLPDNSYYQNNTQKWFIDTIKLNQQISTQTIINNPKKYILQNSYENIMELFDFRELDACYIHAGGMPLGPFDYRYSNMERVVELANVKFVSFNNPKYLTHAYPQQLKYYVDTIAAKVLIPSHGFNPERLLPSGQGQQLIPKLQKTYVYNQTKKTLEEINE